jgi:hypothetical protein
VIDSGTSRAASALIAVGDEFDWRWSHGRRARRSGATDLRCACIVEASHQVGQQMQTYFVLSTDFASPDCSD